ncbi:B12-binding domain-containing protein [Cognatishimia sp. MH4019]|uniref:cobalamin B12-binding domain-containing protein n=1 Tax=Cognatishimia sp. MH4019 TaxID=2854030 RepID=UPI001CD245FA|nr:cobalamin-dependent protein [Cognatishimia sp. MH4019]
MSEGPKKATPLQGSVANDNVDALASQVLTVVASRSPHNAAKVYNRLVQQLVEGVRSMERGAQDAALQELRRYGCTPTDIADIYIPAAARVLGDEWCRDEVSFADVTIGTARLQGMLRDLEREWMLEQPKMPANGPSIAIVCEDDFHTLGSMVIAGQMRRVGASVRLLLGLTMSERMEIFREHSFDIVMISATRTENLETTRKLVKNIRTTCENRLPIVVGGTVIEHNINVKALTGADHVMNDPKEALELCGLKTHHQGGGLSEIRSLTTQKALMSDSDR